MLDKSLLLATSQTVDQHVLLDEICRDAALAELRERFEKLWSKTWEQPVPERAFSDWLLEALNARDASWPPLPGAGLIEDSAITEVTLPVIESWASCVWWHMNSTLTWTEKIFKGEELELSYDSPDVEISSEQALAIKAKAEIMCCTLLSIVEEVRQHWKTRSREASMEFRKEVALHVSMEVRKNGGASAVIVNLCGVLPRDLEEKVVRRHEVHDTHVQRLHEVFEKYCSGRNGDEVISWEAACWVLLSRYQGFFGPCGEGAGFHMAVCPAVLQNLSDEFGVTCELCASPLNAFMSSFCSLFEDVDYLFGSLGSLFKYCRGGMLRTGGSFECNPPFVEHLMLRVVEYLLEALDSTTQALSIALILPDWTETRAFLKATESQYCKSTVEIAGPGHVYFHGLQHVCSKEKLMIRQIRGRGSCVIFLQNDAGATCWPVTPEKIERHQAAWLEGAESTPQAKLVSEPLRFGRSHRLHYHWLQIEADKSSMNLGGPHHPLPKPHRVLDLLPDSEGSCYRYPPQLLEEVQGQQDFVQCSELYRSIDFNTFYDNSLLKQTEIELYFLSSLINKQSCSEWVVVHSDISNGMRFRYLRDAFFPELSVVAFSPDISKWIPDDDERREHIGTVDGRDFVFHGRPFDLEKDPSWIKECSGHKKIAFIATYGGSDNIYEKQESQLQIIQKLCPRMSLVKFKIPGNPQFYDYAPGQMLIPICHYYPNAENYLVIDGSPQQTMRYNCYEICAKMDYHHKNMRGQVYASDRPHDCLACFDSCFDCSILWETVSAYAKRNDADASGILQKLVRDQIYSRSQRGFYNTWESTSWAMEDVIYSLNNGKLTEALVALEMNMTLDGDATDWADIAEHIQYSQPDVASRLKKELQRPVSRNQLIRFLGSLSTPLTLVRNDWNSFVQERWQGPSLKPSAGSDENPLKRQRCVTNFYCRHVVERELLPISH